MKKLTLLVAMTFMAAFALFTVGSTAAHASGCAFPVYNSKGQVVGCVGGGNPGGGGGGSGSGGGGGHTSSPKPKPAPPAHTYHPAPPKHTYHPKPVKTYTPPAKDYCPNGDYTGSRYDGRCGQAPVKVKHKAPVKVVKKAPVKKATPAPTKSVVPTPTVTPTPSASPTATVSATPSVSPSSVPVQNAAHVTSDKGKSNGGVVAAVLGALVLFGGVTGLIFYRKRKNA